MDVIDDAYGYDAYKHRRASLVPSAVAIVVVGASVGSFATLLPPIRSDDAAVIAHSLDTLVASASQDAIQGHISQSHAVVSLVVIASIIVGIAMLAYARSNRRAYMDAYPRIKNFSSESQVQDAHREAMKWLVTGAVLAVGAVLMCAAAVGVQMLAKVDPLSRRAIAVWAGVGLLAMAPSLWCTVHGVMLARRTNIFAYNYEALTRVSRYQIAATQTGERRRIMLGEKAISSVVSIASRIVVALGSVASAALYVLPSCKTPLYWVPLAVALVLWYAIYKLGGWRAKRLYEHRDSENEAAQAQAPSSPATP